MGNCINKQYQFSAPRITVDCTTWARDSYNLFDYESKSVTASEYGLPPWCRLVRTGEKVEVRPVGGPDAAESTALAQVGSARGRYWVFSPSQPIQPQDPLSPPDEDRLWLILRDHVMDETGKTGIRLVQGDIVKLGRCKFVVREIVGDREAGGNMIAGNDRLPTQEALRPQESEQGWEEGESRIGGEAANRCRICLSSSDDKDNPLINSPCRCAGSVKYLHLACLQHWLKSKVMVSHTIALASYSWPQLECDVCKQPYPGIHIPALTMDRGDQGPRRQIAGDCAGGEAGAELHAHAKCGRRCRHAQLYLRDLTHPPNRRHRRLVRTFDQHRHWPWPCLRSQTDRHNRVQKPRDSPGR